MKRQHLLVTTVGHNVETVNFEVIQCMWNFLICRLGTDKVTSDASSYAARFKALSFSSLKAEDATNEETQFVYEGAVPDYDCRECFSGYSEVLVTLKAV